MIISMGLRNHLFYH